MKVIIILQYQKKKDKGPNPIGNMPTLPTPLVTARSFNNKQPLFLKKHLSVNKSASECFQEASVKMLYSYKHALIGKVCIAIKPTFFTFDDNTNKNTKSEIFGRWLSNQQWLSPV